jgi:hypothetical protein
MAVAQILPYVTPASVHLHFINDEITQLAQDLMADEPGMQLFEARAPAAFLLDELEIYAALWDQLAFRAGNDDAMPF